MRTAEAPRLADWLTRAMREQLRPETAYRAAASVVGTEAEVIAAQRFVDARMSVLPWGAYRSLSRPLAGTSLYGLWTEVEA
ncbi:MAG TPA: hypothetical protein VJP77_05710 [Planctomycetota bacterium]|nr:hypothetical protein [Planctomycetota bacterium]